MISGRALILAVGLLLPACDPAAVRAGVADRAAQPVVVNVLVNQYPRPQAEVATECVLANAAPAETEQLARDLGTRAGTSTVATIRSIADRPGSVQCLAARGLAPVAVVP
jgi:hypothetical protein